MSEVNQTKQKWIIAAFVLASIFVLFQFMLQASTSVMVKPLMCDFHINFAQLGFLSSSFFYPYILLQIPSGLLVDRLGPKKLLLGSIFLCALACIFFAISNTAFEASSARMLMGIAAAPSVVCALYIACKRFPCKYFPICAGFVEMLGMLGGAVGESILVYWVHHYSWRVSIWICAGIALVLCLFILFLVPKKSKFNQSESISCPEKNSILSDIKCLLTIPQVWISAAYGSLIFTLLAAFAGMWAVPFLKSLYHSSAHGVAWVSAMLFVGAAIGTPCIGFIYSHWNKLKILMALSSLFCTILLGAIIYFPPKNLNSMVCLFIALGFFSGAYALPFTHIKRIVPSKVHGSAMGLANMLIILLGAPVLIPIIGFILHLQAPIYACSEPSVHSYTLALLPLLILQGIAFILSFCVKYN